MFSQGTNFGRSLPWLSYFFRQRLDLGAHKQCRGETSAPVPRQTCPAMVRFSAGRWDVYDLPRALPEQGR